MNRIDQIFTDLRREGATGEAGGTGGAGGKALMPYLTAGDPDVETTGQMLLAAAEAGAVICEVGLAFSDPVADGPVIEASMTHALSHGTKISAVFEMIAQVREQQPRLGLIAMLSYSMVYRMGLDTFVAQAKAAGFDGFIFPDLPLEESAQAVATVRDAGLILSMLIAPTTDDARAQQIAESCSGFVYVLSRSGITGERDTLASDLPQRVQQLRSATDLPLVVGFGLSSPQQVREVVAVADAAIVGSALMRRVAEVRNQGREAVIAMTRTFVGELAGGLSQQTRPSRV